MRAERTNYKFSLETRKYYYNCYFNYKTLEQEDNILILLELILVDLNKNKMIEKSMEKRVKIFDRSETDLVKFTIFFAYLVDSIDKYKPIYLLLFKTPCTKKQLWDDLVYKLKFKHLHPDLNYDFPNPYENSDKLIF